MSRAAYPFSAVVGQEQMKLALLLAAVDWRLGVLLRGDKGAGKTTAARGVAALLPHPSPFINLPIGATEDRLLGGLHLERTLKGDPVLKPGLLSEAHGGVLYVDEVNLLPAHLGDALLDAASSGVNVVEREGLSASHAAEFILLGSMNPEEGSLRPQLLDRFALAVDVEVPVDPGERQTVVERRIAFDRDPKEFQTSWSASEQQLRAQVTEARALYATMQCSSDILTQISEAVCDAGVRSLRADLAIVRASIAYAALLGDVSVRPEHVRAVMPLALAHRQTDRGRQTAPRLKPSSQETQGEPQQETVPPGGAANAGSETTRIFKPRTAQTFALQATFAESGKRGKSVSTPLSQPGPVVGTRKIDSPVELDVRATLSHALRETGRAQPGVHDLHERVREPRTGTRFLFVIDSSGSHAAQERMRLVKGAATSLLTRSFKHGDEVAIIVFRGTTAQVLLEPSSLREDAITALEYLPTGGRTPLAHALHLARSYLTPATILVLLTDGRANVPLAAGDPWQEALDVAAQMNSTALVIDTERADERLGRSRTLAEALRAEYVELDSPDLTERFVFSLPRVPATSRP